jgi:Sel1 repeat
MNLRILLPLLVLLFIPSGNFSAQQIPDPKQAGLVMYAHFRNLSANELNQLLSKAQTGDAESQFWAGNTYADGFLVAEDLEEAGRWWLKSAEHGYAPAQLAYGLMSRLTNASVGERWMLRSAEQGHAEAQFWLGVAYDQNWFGTHDIQEAIKWYRKAAERGDPDAQVELGQKYEDGEGVEQDYKLAASWYRKAAEHVPDLGGAGQGRNRLAQLYMQGLGVPQDYVQACFWFSLNGQEEFASEAKQHLSSSQIRAVEVLIDEWKEQHRLSPEVAAAIQMLEAKSQYVKSPETASSEARQVP